MKIRLIDIDGKIGQTDLFVLREPKEGEYLYSRNGRNILITEVYQFAKLGGVNSQEEPDLVAMVQYQENGNPVLTDSLGESEQRVIDWLDNGDVNEDL